MTPIQKAFVRELLRLAYSQGFDSSHLLAPIAEKLCVPPSEVLYDNETNTGLLWELGDYGSGLLEFNQSEPATHACVCFDMKELAEHWSRE